jgi:cytochrome c553
MRLWPVLLLPLLTGAALAQEDRAPAPYGLRPLWPAPEARAPDAGDSASGRAVAIGGDRLAGWACAQCHGLDGAAEGSGGFPRLAGQSAWYLYRQLQDYAAGTRPNVVMTPIARAMTEREMRDVAAWYAAQEDAPSSVAPQATTRVLQQGGAINAVGIPERGVTACSNCHGPQGQGAGLAIPALAGQYAPYTALQLRRWKAGERLNGPLGVMTQIASGMTEAEMDAVAAFFATLRPETGTAQAGR